MAVPKLSTDSVVGLPSSPGARKARLTCGTFAPAAAAWRTSPSRTSEDVAKLSLTPVRADAVDRCTEEMG